MERRCDPNDGAYYTYDEIWVHYRSLRYKPEVINSYWDYEMYPEKAKPSGKSKPKAEPKGAKGKGKEKGDGKGKGKAKASPEPKAKAKAKAKAEPKGAAKAVKTAAANPKRFINEEPSIVQDCVDGLIWATPNLARLDGYPDIKVVYRTDWNKDKVSVISGGGAGHEPLHGGFVGRGLLTAAISGETFASPSIDAVLAAIVQVTGPKGCLLVIKNYTGDRLNFTLAAQKARSIYGLQVETVIVKDDVATTAERGIAGTLFVHKVAGAMSEEGKSLSEIKTEVEQVISKSLSLGISLSVVRRLKAESIARKKMEVGLGIHGEPGARTEAMASAKKVVEILMEGLEAGRSAKQLPEPEGWICLLNNLGGVPPQEMCIVLAELMKSKWGNSIKLLVGPAPMCTSLDMNGISISLLPFSSSWSSLICAPVSSSAWPAAVKPEFPTSAAVQVKDCFEGVSPSSDETVKGMLEKACKALIAAKSELDRLDGKVGDADCGSTMAKAATSILEKQERLPMADPKAFCACLSDLLGKTMGGSSGVLLSIMFMGMSSHWESGSNWSSLPEAFKAGLQAMMDAGGASPGSRTMLDALVPAADALIEEKGLTGAAAAAKEGCEATKSMKPKAGRSENMPESVLKGVPDPGAKAVELLFAALS
ncbi:Dihydroxyacetone kinase (DHA kinase) (Glycerone kinase) [Durusdinium trenchii]|uniref:Dihydroxyacetone kinase (DHA kinase) (Glycerone kinase) n=2 Tax=Durusdinium trenchii TaxID=1381693 RepID=A0ABP0LZ41_9DINO